MNKYRIGFWIVLFLIYSRGQAQIFTGAGDALQTMNLPDGAKASALGGAFSAWADDTSAIYWNPAGMVSLPKIQIATAYNQWFQDSFFQDVALVWPKDWGALGGRISYINFGSITGRDAFGYPDGTTLTPEDWGATFAAAVRLGNLSLGMATKLYSESLVAYSYAGLGLDAGALYHLDDLGLAAGIRNIGIITGYSFPVEYYTGATLTLGPQDLQLHLATDTTFTDEDVIVHHGLEIGYKQTVFLRLGYQWLPQLQPDQAQAGLSGGAGIALGDFKLDYAMTSYGDLGLTNQVSISYQFLLPKPGETDEEESASPGTVKNSSRGELETPRPATAPATITPTPSLDETAQVLPVLSLRDSYKTGIEAYKAKNYELAAQWLKKVAAMTYAESEIVYISEANAMLGIIYEYRLKTPDNLNQAMNYYQAALQVDPSNQTAQKHLTELEDAEPSSR